MNKKISQSKSLPHEDDLEDFFEYSRAGFVSANAAGIITRANWRFADWLGYKSDELKGKRFSDFLSVGNRIYYETHLAPLLRMQGFFDEFALELLAQDGSKRPILCNGFERRDTDGNPLFIRFTMINAIDRRTYEKNLHTAKANAESLLSDEKAFSALREQFIAVLSHDLRNPLGAITGGLNILKMITPLNDKGNEVVKMIQDSAKRMGELISDVMDFARGRLGGGISLTREQVNLEPVLMHVVAELQAGYPDRKIETEIALSDKINCDKGRVSQLLSNLVGNALTHGSYEGIVYVWSLIKNGFFELSVSNTGNPISSDAIARLFQPFTRDEVRPSLQGLGLGLYIASQIAAAHGGTLEAKSSTIETRFTFRMPV